MLKNNSYIFILIFDDCIISILDSIIEENTRKMDILRISAKTISKNNEIKRYYVKKLMHRCVQLK